MKCLNCGTEFESIRKSAKFDSVKCKLAYHRKEVSVSKPLSVSEESDTVTPEETPSFTPNWKRMGFPDKETARLFVLATLADAAKTSGSTLGFNGEATWIINGRTVILTKKGFQEVSAREFTPNILRVD